MWSTLVKRLAQFSPFVLALLVLLGDAKPARADMRCFQDLRDCYGRAAGRASYWDMWLAGLDCELTFTDCARRAIIGR